MAESPCLGLLHSPPNKRNPPPRGTLFNYKPANRVYTPTHFPFRLSFSGPLHTCPNHHGPEVRQVERAAVHQAHWNYSFQWILNPLTLLPLLLLMETTIKAFAHSFLSFWLTLTLLLPYVPPPRHPAGIRCDMHTFSWCLCYNKLFFPNGNCLLIYWLHHT